MCIRDSIIIAVVVLAGAVSTVAIVRGGGVSESRNTQQVEYQPMKTVYLAMDRVETLNPLVSSDSDVFYISQLVYSSLFRLDENLNIEPDLVKSYKTSPSEGSVSIKLRQDVKFSDGSSLTAADVSYTVNRIPVSYTHLDVYKRQEQCRDEGFGLCPCGKRHRRNSHELQP